MRCCTCSRPRPAATGTGGRAGGPTTALAMAVRGPGPGAPLRVRHPAGDPHRPRLPAAGVRDGRLRLVALASAEHDRLRPPDGPPADGTVAWRCHSGRV